MAGLSDSAAVREALVGALRLDLFGPGAGHALARERLPGRVRPSNWYLTGFLVPRGAPVRQRGDADVDDEVEVAENVGLGDDSMEDRRAAKKGFFPSSMGLSFLVGEGLDSLVVAVRWGDYRRVEAEAGDPSRDRGVGAVGAGPGHEGQGESRGEIEEGIGETTPTTGHTGQGGGSGVRAWWQRIPREEIVSLTLPASMDSPDTVKVPDSGGLALHTVVRPVDAASFAGRIAPGTRSVSLFLVNDRIPSTDRDRDESFAFQTEIEVRSVAPFVPRPDPREVSGEEWDEQIADLHYADTPEYAAGHGVSADWELVDGGCRVLRTTWTPGAEVEKTETFDVPGTELDMRALGALPDGPAVEAALWPLAMEYRSWIDGRKRDVGAFGGERRKAAEELLRLAGVAADRIERGIRTLAGDADALDAFRTANRTVADALSRRLAREGGRQPPRWRAFQLAFILLNLPGIADPASPERAFVDLLFFPTGGGKTEAYLGLAAFTMVLRRLHNPVDDHRAGAGVSVIMRYTLLLLTLDQLGRAAGLVCALERERRRDPGTLGGWPFEIGLWVGKAGTPNRLGARGDGRSDSARSKVSQYKNNPRGKPSPIPLESCPWCGEDFTPESFTLLPDSDHPSDLRIACANWQCEFSADDPLPIVAVDEPLYRRLPAFLIATVDKFASLPWVGESGALLGGADRHDHSGFYGAAEPRVGHRLQRPLPPPDLVISGRAAPDFRPAGHHGRALRNGDRSAVHADDRGAADQAEDRRFHRHRPARSGTDSMPLRAPQHPGVSTAGAGSPGLLLRPHPVRIGTERAALERLLQEVFGARIDEQPFDAAERAERQRSLRNRIGDLLDSWMAIHDDYHRDGVPMQYQKYEAATRKPLLREMLDTDFDSHHHRKFRANRSLRDVEPQVNLYLRDLSSRLSGGGGP